MKYIKKIELSLSTSYVSDWSVEDAIRELIQNALDTENYSINTGDDFIEINSYGGTIPEEYLLLGGGNKRDNDSSRGGFSEGFKLAFLILAREGCDVHFINGNSSWKPLITYSEQYNADCLVVEVYDLEYNADGVEVIVSGLSEEQLTTITDRTLSLQQDYHCHETSCGQILLEDQHKGKVFVGGLFVDMFDSEYGFNFNPDSFELDRDRRCLKPFDIQWKTKDMWAEVTEKATGDVADQVLSAMASYDNSIQFVGSASLKPSESVREKAEEHYKKKYDGIIVSSNYSEVEALQKAGNKATYVSNEGFVKIIRETEAHRTVMLGKKSLKSVEDLLEDWKDEWYDSFSSDMLYSFEELIEEIKNR